MSGRIFSHRKCRRAALWVSQQCCTFLAFSSHGETLTTIPPSGFLTPEHIVHNSCSCIPNATLYHFGILSSAMYMAWLGAVCGRIKSDFCYSNTLLYNNYPWPQTTSAQVSAIEAAAQGVLDTRARFPNSSLADLYDQNTMPDELTRVHRSLDKAVDSAYGKQPFDTERQRVENLLNCTSN